jgi:hypothetical protein
MFDLRYHVASLAAVFLALIIGIVVGVGISDRGLVDSTKTKLLESQVTRLQNQVSQSANQAAKQTHQSQAAKTFIDETYPVLVRNRLRGKKIAVVFVGSEASGVSGAISSALTDAGAQQLRLRVLTVPVDMKQINTALASQPAAASFTGKSRLEDLGRGLGQELVYGGQTPLWNSLTEVLVAHTVGGTKAPADGVVIVRTAPPQRGATRRLLEGLYSGLKGNGVPAVGVEQTDARPSAVDVFGKNGLSTVDDVDRPEGQLALVLLLAGAPSGQYGVKSTAGDGALPPWPTTAAGG